MSHLELLEKCLQQLIVKRMSRVNRECQTSNSYSVNSLETREHHFFCSIIRMALSILGNFQTIRTSTINGDSNEENFAITRSSPYLRRSEKLGQSYENQGLVDHAQVKTKNTNSFHERENIFILCDSISTHGKNWKEYFQTKCSTLNE